MHIQTVHPNCRPGFIDPKILSSLVWWIKRFCSLRSRFASTRFCPWNPWNWANHRFRWFVVINVLQDPWNWANHNKCGSLLSNGRFLEVNCKQTCPCKICWLLHQQLKWSGRLTSGRLFVVRMALTYIYLYPHIWSPWHTYVDMHTHFRVTWPAED